MKRDKKRDYEVGYGKPPIHTRYKQGQSGNPRGRPSGSKNLRTLVTDAVNELVVVTEEGRRRKISKRQAMIMQLVNQALKGDLRAFKILLEILRDIEDRSETETGKNTFGAADQKILEHFMTRLRGRNGESDA
jgi:hypothetical protein